MEPDVAQKIVLSLIGLSGVIGTVVFFRLPNHACNSSQYDQPNPAPEADSKIHETQDKQQHESTSSETKDSYEDHNLVLLTDMIVNRIHSLWGISIRNDRMAMLRITTKAKKALSLLKSTHIVVIDLPFIARSQEDPKHLKFNLTKDDLDSYWKNESNQYYSETNSSDQTDQEKQEEKSKQQQKEKASHRKDEKHYGRVLKLKGKVTFSDVKRNYRELAGQYHPDKVDHLGDKLKKLAEKEFKEINEAFDYFKQKSKK